MFMSPLSGVHWTTVVFMAGFKIRKLQTRGGHQVIRLQGYELLPVYSLLKSMWTSLKATGVMFYLQIRPKYNFLVQIRSVLFGERKTLNSRLRASSHLWNMVAVVSCFEACFAASGARKLTIVDGTMNSELYEQILILNVRTCVHGLRRKRYWVMQQDNDPKHTSHSTKEWLKKNKLKVLHWLSQSPDFNPIEILWKDLKWAVHLSKSGNIPELKKICMKEWGKIPPGWHAGLIMHLVAVIVVKGSHTKYQKQRFTYFSTHRFVTLDHFPQ